MILFYKRNCICCCVRKIIHDEFDADEKDKRFVDDWGKPMFYRIIIRNEFELKKKYFLESCGGLHWRCQLQRLSKHQKRLQKTQLMSNFLKKITTQCINVIYFQKEFSTISMKWHFLKENFKHMAYPRSVFLQSCWNSKSGRVLTSIGELVHYSTYYVCLQIIYLVQSTFTHFDTWTCSDFHYSN